MPSGPRPPIPPLIAKAEFAGIIYGHQWRNIAYLSLGGTGIGNADLNTLATSMNTAWGTRFKPLVTADCALTSIKLTYVPSVGSEIQGIATVSQTGTLAGSAVQDSSAAVVVNWNVNKYYRGGHPRWYMPGIVTTAVTNGSLISSTTRTNFAAAGNGFINDVNAMTTTNITSVVLGTLSFQHANAWRNPPSFWQFFTASVPQYLGSQRRRIRS